MDGSSVKILIAIVSMEVIFWLGLSYILYKIGKKLNNQEGFWNYVIPIYNIYLLCKGAKISGWFTLGIAIPYIVILTSVFSFDTNSADVINIIVNITIIIFSSYIFGMVAKRLGKNPWLWGILIALLGIPLIILAFDSSKVVDEDVKELEDYNINDKFQIEFLSGEFAGNSMEIPNDGIIIGREASMSNLIVDSDKISRQHVKIYIENNQVVIEDLNSSNGIFIGNINDGYKKVNQKEYVTSSDLNFFLVEPELLSFQISRL